MILTREKKQALIDELKGLFRDSSVSLCSNYSGLGGVDLTILRKNLKAKGIRVVVTKNTLVRKVLDELKLELDGGMLDQPVLFAFGEDEVEVSKELMGFAKEHEQLEILGGLIRGETTDSAKIKILALLPGREELQAKVVGSLAAPLSGFVNVLAGNIRGLVNVLKQYQEKIS